MSDRAVVSEGERESCPTCNHNGSEESPFDGNCPAVWAHQHLRPNGWLETRASRPVAPEKPPAVPPPEMVEALDEFEKQCRNDAHLPPSARNLTAYARARIEQLFREQREENERLKDARHSIERAFLALKKEQLTPVEAASLFDRMSEGVPPEALHLLRDMAASQYHDIRKSALDKLRSVLRSGHTSTRGEE